MTAQPVVPAESPVHEIKNGMDCHYFSKVNGLWVCDCGETRDTAGRPIQP